MNTHMTSPWSSKFYVDYIKQIESMIFFFNFFIHKTLILQINNSHYLSFIYLAAILHCFVYII